MTSFSIGDHFDFSDYDEFDEFEEQSGLLNINDRKKEALLFLIDASASMYKIEKESNKSFIQIALQSVIDTMMNRIIMSDTDLIALMFYGTREKKNIGGFDNIVLKYHFDSPDVEFILKLERYVHQPELLQDELGTTESYSLSELFWCCSMMFSSLKSKSIYPRRIIMFTNNDDPHGGNIILKRATRSRTNDLFDNKITLDLFCWSADLENTFNSSLFYKDLLSLEEDEPHGTVNCFEKLEDFKTKLHRKEIKARSAFRTILKLHEDFEIAVQGFHLIIDRNKATKLNNGYRSIYLEPKTNQLVEVKTKYICEDTNKEVKLNDMLYGYDYGGETVLFTKDELQEIKSLYKPGMELLGFHSRSFLKPQYNIKFPSFIYPDEKRISGSTSVFANLLVSMHQMDKIAICRFCSRENTKPRLVALFPQYDDPKYPDGFHVIYLPFEDDIRSIPAGPLPAVEGEFVDKAKKIVKSLTIKNFDLENYPNPAVHQRFMNLQAIALERETAEQVYDHTLPMNDVIEKVAGSFIREFREMAAEDFPEMLEDFDDGTLKRRHENEDELEKTKKAKRNDAILSNEDIQKAIQDNKIEKFTVAVLTQFLKSQGISKIPKRKAEIIKLIKSLNED